MPVAIAVITTATCEWPDARCELALTKPIAVALPFFVRLVPIDANMLAHLRLQNLIEDRFN